MKDVKLSIVIKSNCDISAISSLMQQSNDSWECFIINNTIKNIEQYIINNKHFILVDNTKKHNTIMDTIKRVHGEYILLIDSDTILAPNAVEDILHMADLTNADVIKFKSETGNVIFDEESDKKCTFRYVFDKNTIMENVFDNLSEFCFKKGIISNSINSEHAFIMNNLIQSKDMAITKKICTIRQQDNQINNNEYITIVNNYIQNKTKLDLYFWKKYFKTIIPNMIKQTIQSNDKKTFVEFCKKTPMSFIPLRYKIICYMLVKTSK